MKIPLFALALATTFTFSQFADAGTSAKQAIETLKKAEGADVTGHILGLTGRFGQDQPQEWEILARRGKQFAMFIVDRNSILSISTVRTKARAKLATNALKCDSSKAFRVSDQAAKKASIGFDSLNYELKPRTDSAAPVWIVSLVDVEGQTVGRIHVAADSGSVLRQNWDRVQLNRPVPVPTAVAASPAASTGGSRGILSDRRTTSVQTATTGDGVRESFAKAGDSIRSVFRKGEVSNTNEQHAPKTTKSRPN